MPSHLEPYNISPFSIEARVYEDRIVEFSKCLGRPLMNVGEIDQIQEQCIMGGFYSIQSQYISFQWEVTLCSLMHLWMICCKMFIFCISLSGNFPLLLKGGLFG